MICSDCVFWGDFFEPKKYVCLKQCKEKLDPNGEWCDEYEKDNGL